mmetsp:Transcript_68752/g.163770  ORF Transcript_68752/g.163770 Transcript_68752/m.163770 type:complete len:83 (-) Transcript_68752:1051-1299(-)
MLSRGEDTDEKESVGVCCKRQRSVALPSLPMFSLAAVEVGDCVDDNCKLLCSLPLRLDLWPLGCRQHEATRTSSFRKQCDCD